MRTSLPYFLVFARACAGFLVLALAYVWPSPSLFGALLVFALLSDIFDGKLARRWGTATPALRRLDSITDTIFYVCVLLGSWELYSEDLMPYRTWFFVLLGLELTRYIFDYVKFRREASYHMWSAKLWGLVLFITFFAILALQTPSASLIRLALAIGIVSDGEGLAISLVLRKWQTDVPSLYHVLKNKKPLRSP